MGKPEHRLAADRGGLRYPSDLIDAEWALIAPLIPLARRGGRKRSVVSSSGTFAWVSRNRRLARDFERYATTVAAFLRLAMIRIMLKRLTRPSH